MFTLYQENTNWSFRVHPSVNFWNFIPQREKGKVEYIAFISDDKVIANLICNQRIWNKSYCLKSNNRLKLWLYTTYVIVIALPFSIISPLSLKVSQKKTQDTCTSLGRRFVWQTDSHFMQESKNSKKSQDKILAISFIPSFFSNV